jgi:hypothetical protein
MFEPDSERGLLLPAGMEPSDPPKPSRLQRLLRSTVFRGTSSLLWTWVVLLLSSSRTTIQLVLALALLATATLFLGRALVRRSLQKDERLAELVRGDLRLAAAWIVTAVLLAGLAIVVELPVAAALLGAAAAASLNSRGIAAGGDAALKEQVAEIGGGSALLEATSWSARWLRRSTSAPRQPLSRAFRRAIGPKRSCGEISAYLDYTLLATAWIAAGYLGLAAAELFVDVIPLGTVVALLRG